MMKNLPLKPHIFTWLGLFYVVAIVTKLNNLLEQLNVSSRLKTIADIGAGVFVTLFEGLCGEQLPGNKWRLMHPEFKIQEIFPEICKSDEQTSAL